jgi:uncharacterized Zn-binding protein involved in type VI secretion
MPAVCRVGDELNTGHGCDGTTTIDSSNTDGTVHANDIDVIVIGAPTVSHDITSGDDCAAHTDVTKEGSPNVFINNIAVTRKKDAVDSGNMTEGSPNVFANGE